MIEMTDSTVSLEDIREWMVGTYVSELKKYLREKVPKEYMRDVPTEDSVTEILEAFLRDYIGDDDKLVEAIRNAFLSK